MPSKKRLLVAIALLACLCLIIAATLYLRSKDSALDQVEQIYQKGEQAKTVGERREYFNQALTEYLKLEQQFQPTMGTGKLYYNIANTYYHLGEYPSAIYYYHRAMDLRPRDQAVTDNLTTAEKALGIQTKPTDSIFHKLFFFYYKLSVPEQIQLISLFALLCFVCFSLQIWIPRRLWKRIAYAAGFGMLVLLLSVGYAHYFAPINAIMMRASDLYRGAGSYYARVVDKPIPSGIEVEVLESLEGGKWLKVATPDGALGYLPSDALRIL